VVFVDLINYPRTVADVIYRQCQDKIVGDKPGNGQGNGAALRSVYRNLGYCCTRTYQITVGIKRNGRVGWQLVRTLHIIHRVGNIDITALACIDNFINRYRSVRELAAEGNYYILYYYTILIRCHPNI